MNLLKDAMHLVSLCTFFCDRGASILMIASIFSGLASIPRWLTMNPSNFLASTPKTHFSGLSFHRYRRRLLKTRCKYSMKFSEFSVLITTSAGCHANTSRLSCRNWTSALSYLSSRLELMMAVLRSSTNPRLILLVSSVGRIEVTA
jgi:hypothetical protein